MSARFVVCPACARHVKAGACICPFCGAKAHCAKPVRTIAGRLSRAAMHAAGAVGAVSAVVALNDCTSAQSGAGYGGFCVPDACGGYVEQDTGADTTVIAEASVTEAAPPDASSDTSEAAVDAADAGTGDASPDGGVD
jgi:hypothetical protein